MRKPKKTIGKKRRAHVSLMDRAELFVRSELSGFCRAHIRVKHGGYRYLTWRDGERVRSIYLGKKQK